MLRFINIVDNVFVIFGLVVLIRILLSWVPISPLSRGGRAVMDFFRDSTEWYLGFFRRFIPMLGPVDISPVVALFVLFAVREFVVELLVRFAL